MSFGRLFATIFFGGLCPGAALLAMLAAPRGLEVAAIVAGLVAALALAVGLARSYRWSRTLGAFASLAAIVVGGRIALERGGIAELLFVMAAMTSFVLLVLAGSSGTARPAQRGSLPIAALSSLGLVAFVALVVIAPQREARRLGSDDAMPASRADRVIWADFGTGLERARREGRPVLAHFYAGWCGYCRQMDRDTWEHPGVIDRMAELTAVRVNIDQTQAINGFAGNQLASRYRVHGTPSQLLLDASGQVLARAGGYQDSEQFLRWLDSALNRRGGRPALDTQSVSGTP